MALASGSRIGSYEVNAKLGEGGMGEVYRATDTRLKRQVAIKVLPEALASDAERLARFQREAEVLASLNHPNIAQLHGLEESADVKALVMELVEGPTLADRIAQGVMPVVEALAIAKQIAAALEAAHEQGVVHRDLKPANVKVRDDGMVKVLDFGLAKLADAAPGSNISSTLSPTLSLNATMAGVILGTAAYMAPEQARGKSVDKRADIWAFGAVLYEMVTASQPFPGEDVSHVLARVIDREPDWSLLPSALPPSVRTCLQRCLVKDPRQRIRDIGDVRLALEGAFETQAPSIATGDAGAGASPLPLWRRVLPALGASVVLAGLTGGALWLLTRPAPPTVTRFVLTTPPDGDIDIANRVNLAIAPDGTVAYASVQGIYIRRLGVTDPEMLRSREQGQPTTPFFVAPFFSPDGASIGFVELPAPFALKRAPSLGGPATTIASLAFAPFGASWGPGNTIVVSGPKGLVRLNASGGNLEPLTTVSAEGETHRWPHVLPNGRGVLFTVWSGNLESARIAVVSLETGTVTPLVASGTSPTYSPTGHLGHRRRCVVDQRPVSRNPVIGRASDLVHVDVLENGRLPFSSHRQAISIERDSTQAATCRVHPKYMVPSGDSNHHPIWSQDSRALYYVPAARQFARVPITTAPRFAFGTPEGVRAESNGPHRGSESAEAIGHHA